MGTVLTKRRNMAVSFCQYRLLSGLTDIALLLHFNPALHEIDRIMTVASYVQSLQLTWSKMLNFLQSYITLHLAFLGHTVKTRAKFRSLPWREGGFFGPRPTMITGF